MKTIWTGTVDNLEIAGWPKGDQQPMRVVVDDDGRLMTEFAFSSEDETGTIEYDTARWIADTAIRFRDMNPKPSDSLVKEMTSQKLLSR